MWGFATATADGGPTRISLLLDTVADISSGGSARADRPLYHTFETLRPEIEASPEALWEKVVDLHSLVRGWYDDRNLFHKIGYVIAAGGSTFLDLVVLAQTRTKSEFDSELRELIRASLNLSRSGVASLTYGLAKTRAVLLLMNVETVRRHTHSSERYSFDAHAQRRWSLEHIHAQNSQGLSTVAQWTTWLREHLKALDALDLPEAEFAAITERIDAALPTITSETFELLPRKERKGPLRGGRCGVPEEDDDAPEGEDVAVGEDGARDPPSVHEGAVRAAVVVQHDVVPPTLERGVPPGDRHVLEGDDVGVGRGR